MNRLEEMLHFLVKWTVTAAVALFLVFIFYIIGIGGAMDARACEDSPRLEFQDRERTFEMQRQTFEMQRLNNILRRAEINRNRGGDVRFENLLRRSGPYRLMPPR